MEMTRSEFIRSVAAGAGTALTGLGAVRVHGALSENGYPGKTSMDVQLTKDVFSQNLNSDFKFCEKTSPTTIDAKLVEVTEGRSSEQQEQFSLLFVGPEKPVLSQQIFGVEHSEMGSFDLFLVPVGVDDRGMLYEAVFNRLRS